jgi:hypothetical protein
MLEFSLARTPSDLLLQLYLLVELVLYKLDVPVYKKVSYPKQRSLLVLHVFILPCHLTRVLPGRVTSYPISYPRRLPRFYPRLCPIPYSSLYPEPYPSHTRVRYLNFYLRLCPIPYLNLYPEPYLSRYPRRTRSG